MAAVDLRPMSLGEVLDRTFALYKQNFWLFVGITAIPFLVLLVFRVGFAAMTTATTAVTSLPQAGEPTPVVPTAAFGGVFAGAIVVGIMYLLLVGAAQAATIFAVSDLYLGNTASVRGSYSRVGSKALRVLLILLLVALSVGVGFIFLIIPGFILLCRTAISVPASMLEDSKAIRSIERSMELTKGHAMQIFLIFLLVWVMSYVAALIFQVPFLFFQAGALKAHQSLSLGMIVLQNLSAFLSEVLVGPVGTIAFSLMYYNLRVRKEAFDVQHLMASLGTQVAPGATPAI
jgi:uncharacterized membrane protein